MDKGITTKVNKFVSDNSLHTVNYYNLKEAAEKLGYSVIEFNGVFNDGDVAALIKDLKLDEVVMRSRGFTYADRNFRLIFINEDLNEEEKVFVISHELGHIVCEHFGAGPVIGNDVREEHEASGFAHYLLNKSCWRKLQVRLITANKKALVSIVLAIAIIFLAVMGGMAYNKKVSYSEFYKTESGNKYHKKECIFVKEKKNIKKLTKKEFNTGEYEACEICLPDK